MTTLLADSGSVVLMSVFKPIVFIVVVGFWASVASRFDKDLARFFTPRERYLWNGVMGLAGLVGIGLWLLVPFFWVGLFMALILMGGALGGYVAWRNPRVPAKVRWKLSLASLTKRIEKMQETAAQRAATVRLTGKDDAPLEVPTANDPLAPAHDAMEQLVQYALSRGAQRVELLAEAQHTSAVVLVDGVAYPQPALEAKLGLSLIDYLKNRAGLDVNDRRRRQTGTVGVLADSLGRHELGLTTLGSTRGLSLDIDIDPSEGRNLGFDKLGLLEPQQQQLAQALDTPGRIVMVVSPPRQGQTTTLYSLLSRHDPYTQTIATFQHDIPFQLEGVSHERIDPAADAAAINQRLKVLILREPQVIMLDRVTDSQTAQLLASYAGSIRFYFGLRQEDTFSALRAWIKAAGDPQTAANSLAAIVSQRLVRKLCPACRVSYKPEAEALRRLNLPADRVSQLFRESGQVLVNNQPKPCSMCQGIGFRGRTGVFEVMALDDEARELIVANQFEQLRAYLRKQKTMWLQETAIARVVEGVTSIKEVTRALAKEAGK